MENERLTWDEIVEKYPDKWVGLSNVDWKNQANIRSGIVKYAGSSCEEPMRRRLAGEDIHAVYTTPDNLCPLGILAGTR